MRTEVIVGTARKIIGAKLGNGRVMFWDNNVRRVYHYYADGSINSSSRLPEIPDMLQRINGACEAQNTIVMDYIREGDTVSFHFDL